MKRRGRTDTPDFECSLHGKAIRVSRAGFAMKMASSLAYGSRTIGRAAIGELFLLSESIGSNQLPVGPGTRRKRLGRTHTRGFERSSRGRDTAGFRAAIGTTTDSIWASRFTTSERVDGAGSCLMSALVCLIRSLAGRGTPSTEYHSHCDAGASHAGNSGRTAVSTSATYAQNVLSPLRDAALSPARKSTRAVGWPFTSTLAVPGTWLPRK